MTLAGLEAASDERLGSGERFGRRPRVRLELDASRMISHDFRQHREVPDAVAVFTGSRERRRDFPEAFTVRTLVPCSENPPLFLDGNTLCPEASGADNRVHGTPPVGCKALEKIPTYHYTLLFI